MFIFIINCMNKNDNVDSAKIFSRQLLIPSAHISDEYGFARFANWYKHSCCLGNQAFKPHPVSQIISTQLLLIVAIYIVAILTTTWLCKFSFIKMVYVV